MVATGENGCNFAHNSCAFCTCLAYDWPTCCVLPGDIFDRVCRRRYAEEVGELEKTCDDLTNERNAMLVRLEGLKRRKQVEKEVSAQPHRRAGTATVAARIFCCNGALACAW